MVTKKNNNNTRGNQVRVVTNWQHTQELTPAFRRLMVLLLETKHCKEDRGVRDK